MYEPTVVDVLHHRVELADRLATLATDMCAESDVTRAADSIIRCLSDITCCDDVGVVLVNGRHVVDTVAATAEAVKEADELQFELGEGPSLTVMQGDDFTVVNDGDQINRWHRWSPLMRELGFRSVASIRLATDRTICGAVNLYSTRPTWDCARDLEAAHLLARHASLALDDARHLTTLRQAIESRHHIGQAQGILMERLGLDAEQAFAVLRRYSQDSNVKVRRVAEEIVASRALPDSAEPPGG